MIRWTIAIAVGLLAGWITYGRAGGAAPRLRVLAGVLRAAAVSIVAALLFGASAGSSVERGRVIAVDASASWLRAARNESTTVSTLREWLADSVFSREPADSRVLLFGDSIRETSRESVGHFRPADARSSAREAVDRAAALGAPLTIVTDGEIDDPEAVSDAPAGSRVMVLPRSLSGKDELDAAIVDLSIPTAARNGDTIRVSVTVQSGPVATPPAEITVGVGARVQTKLPVPAMVPFSSLVLSGLLKLEATDSIELVTAAVSMDGDRERRNDSLTARLRVGDVTPVVAVSTAPDLDWREALSVMRSGLGLPVRGYIRVAPGLWRVEGTFAPVSEAQVRERAGSSGMLFLHGDTTWAVGIKRGNERSSVLWVPAMPEEPARAGAITRRAEWYVAEAPPSPLSAALAGLPVDSLPPVTLPVDRLQQFMFSGERAGSSGHDSTLPSSSHKPSAQGSWLATPALTMRLEKAGPQVAALTTREGKAGQRAAVVLGSGYAGWVLRGGRSQQSFLALFGSAFDWVAAARSDERPVFASGSIIREGDVVNWRRGSVDTLFRVVLRRREDAHTPASPASRGDTLILAFGANRFETISAPLAAGVYDVATNNLHDVLVVNQSREWLPRQPTVTDQSVSGAIRSRSAAPRLTDSGWPFVLSLLLLCAEWIVRRSHGRP